MVRFSRSAVTPGPETASLTPRLMIPTNLACCSGNDVQHAKESRGSRGFGGLRSMVIAARGFHWPFVLSAHARPCCLFEGQAGMFLCPALQPSLWSDEKRASPRRYEPPLLHLTGCAKYPIGVVHDRDRLEGANRPRSQIMTPGPSRAARDRPLVARSSSLQPGSAWLRGKRPN
jgi:hypothetical protein